MTVIESYSSFEMARHRSLVVGDAEVDRETGAIVRIGDDKEYNGGETMSDKPILFSGPMVRAILAGQKTQTRRVIENMPDEPVCDGAYFDAYDHGPFWNWWCGDNRCCLPQIKFPYGKIGDLLWVRENWGFYGTSTSLWGASEIDNHATVFYHADRKKMDIPFKSSAEMHAATPQQNIKYPDNYDTLDEAARDEVYHQLLNEWWRRKRSIPSIHMYRWASRITLRITDIRAERLQDISEYDAIAEGCLNDVVFEYDGMGGPVDYRGLYAVERFEELWDSINGKRPGCSWDDNPWVWVVCFEPITKNITR